MDSTGKILNSILARFLKIKTQKINWDLKIKPVFIKIIKMNNKINSKISIKVNLKS